MYQSQSPNLVLMGHLLDHKIPFSCLVQYCLLQFEAIVAALKRIEHLPYLQTMYFMWTHNLVDPVGFPTWDYCGRHTDRCFVGLYKIRFQHLKTCQKGFRSTRQSKQDHCSGMIFRWGAKMCCLK